MAYEKRLCLLKQVKRGFSADGAPLTGAVYAERLGSELVLTPRIAGLSPLKEGRYALAVGIGEWKKCFELRGNEALRASDAPTLAGGFSVLLCYVNGEAEAVAFGRCGNAEADYRVLLGIFSEPSHGVSGESAVAEEKSDPVCEKYDDEAIADGDYYESDRVMTDEGAVEAEQPFRGKERGGDEGVEHPFRLGRGGLTYYNSIAERLSLAFRKYPQDTRLCAAIPHSEWVKTEKALLGVVYAEGLPRYLCVALEEEPPEEAKEASVFVPLSPYSDEEGLFVVFQDADTGEYVKSELS